MISPERSAAFGAELAERRRRGRPRSAQPTQKATVSLPVAVFDALCARAAQERVPLHRLLNHALASFARTEFHP
jgi:hypothetical protein